MLKQRERTILRVTAQRKEKYMHICLKYPRDLKPIASKPNLVQTGKIYDTRKIRREIFDVFGPRIDIRSLISVLYLSFRQMRIFNDFSCAVRYSISTFTRKDFAMHCIAEERNIGMQEANGNTSLLR